jgi:hypothetical protein
MSNKIKHPILASSVKAGPPVSSNPTGGLYSPASSKPTYSIYDISSIVSSGILTPTEGEKYIDDNVTTISFGEAMSLVNSKVWRRERFKEWITVSLKSDPNALDPNEVLNIASLNVWSPARCRQYLKRKKVYACITLFHAMSFYATEIWSLDETRRFLKLGPIPYEGAADFSS